MGIAHHANYIVWFEIGRTDLCRATGFPYNEIEARGFILVVTDMQCRYRVPYRYDSEVVIRTTVAELASRSGFPAMTATELRPLSFGPARSLPSRTSQT